MKKSWIILLICFTFLTAWSQSYTVRSTPNPQTADARSFVSNPDGILSAQTVSELNTKIDSLRQSTGTEIAVVALNSIGEQSIENFSLELAQFWGVGSKENNNGLLILFVMDQRKLRFETGYGLEGVLPDAVAFDIREQLIIPEFKKGDYDAGILAGVEAVIQTVKGEPFSPKGKEPINWSEVIPYAAAIYIIFMLFTWFWITSFVKKVHQNKVLSTNLARYKAINDQNKATYAISAITIPLIAFFGIILLSNIAYILLLFPAPIAALPSYFYGKKMAKKARSQPIPCNFCSSKMHMLSEREEDTRLKLSQQFEEKLNSVDYDVFVCDSCKNEAVFSLDKLNVYTRCPRCHTKAYLLHSKRTVMMPTYLNSGTQRSTYKCKFCGFEDHSDTKIPRLRRTSAFTGGAVGGGVYSGRGGFGGGGSFGGGRFGGGGGTSGW